jgi:glycosyltransferase involved in cell wall biosynthesis
MEALASGLPVVAANAMALPHLVHSGENGYLYEPGDVDAMTGYLTKVLTMPQDELDRLKKGSLEMIKPHDIQRTLDTFEAIYRGETITDPVTENIPTL